jgi:RNA polymerase sigma-70 factor, ECF subfamily
VGGLTRYVGDVGLAEELAQDAMVDALTQWPVEGTPRQPGAWLMTVGKRKAVDRLRRDQVLRTKYAQIASTEVIADLHRDVPGAVDERSGDHIDDDILRLMFIACHPVVPVAGRVALTLRLVGGLTTAEIARAYVQSEATVAQRIVRAKRTIAAAGVPFEVPVGDDRAARLTSVLEVIYLVFNEGYAATTGDGWMRPTLCAEAVRIGRILAGLAPDEPEVLGLLALLEIQSSRLRARTGVDGEPLLLRDQDRRQWDRLSINRGLDALRRADELGERRGPYTLQAAIAACHAMAFRVDDTDWVRVAGLYDVLAETAPSPIVELNRAVAVSMAFGPDLGLDLVEQIVATRTLDSYHLLHSVRGDLLDRVGRHVEAEREFGRAAELTENASERKLLSDRADQSHRLADVTVVPDSAGADPRPLRA